MKYLNYLVMAMFAICVTFCRKWWIYNSDIEKAKNGDTEAMAEYVSILEEAIELGGKLAVFQNMSSSQLARYQRINNKMLKAAESM